MSDGAIARIQPVQIQAFTTEQRDLIRRTVAPNATDDELAMFLHIAQRSGLDPLRRQMHFMKHSGRVTIVADVNGLQARAAREPDFEGLLHAVVYEKDTFEVDNATGQVSKHANNPLGSNGKIVGAWATVRRRGMLPFTAVVRFTEYENSNNPLWKSKPAVMIDKVAKSTALRLAYPEQLGGIYDSAELAEEKEVNAPPPAVALAAASAPSRSAAVKEDVKRKLQVIDVKPGETEAQAERRTIPYEALVAKMAEHSIPVSEFGPKLRELTGRTKRAEVTAEDVAKVLAFYFPEPPDDAPPPPSDADAPQEVGQ